MQTTEQQSEQLVSQWVKESMRFGAVWAVSGERCAVYGVRCGVNSRRAAAVGFQRSSILRSDLNGQRHGGKLFGVQNLKQKCLTAFSPAADGAEGRCCT